MCHARERAYVRTTACDATERTTCQPQSVQICDKGCLKTACGSGLSALCGLALSLHRTSGRARPRGHEPPVKESVCQPMTIIVVRVTGRSKCI